MRLIYFFLIILSSSVFTKVSGQTLLRIDSLTYTFRSAQSDNELMPLSEEDPNYKEPEAELFITFYVSDTLHLKSVDLVFSTNNGNGDFKKVKRDLDSKEQRDILLSRNEVRFINGNKIMVKCNVPISISRKRIYLTMKAIDDTDGESNQLYKIFN